MTTMAMGNDNNDVNGDDATGNKVDDDGDGATGNDNDDNNDGDDGNDGNNGDGDGTMGSGVMGVDKHRCQLLAGIYVYLQKCRTGP